MTIILLAIIFAIVSHSGVAQDTSTLAIQSLGFALNITLATVLLSIEVSRGTRGLLANAHLTTMLVLMVLLPMVHFLKDSLRLDSLLPASITPAAVTYTNSLVLIWFLSFAVGYRTRVASRLARHLAARIGAVTTSGLKFQVLLGFVALGYLGYRVGVGAFTRLAFEDRFAGSNPTDTLLLEVPARIAPIFAWATTVACIRAKPRGRRGPLYLLLGMLTVGILLVDNPIAAPRYWTGLVAIGTLCVLGLFRGRRAGILLCLVILFSLLVAAPSLNIGRYQSDFRIAFESARVTAPDQISYGSFAHTIAVEDYITAQGTTMGRQLLGAALVWVPRAWWSAKPVGSGSLIAMQAGQGFTNIDTPLPAEALINFGLLGIPLFAAAFGLICRLFDEWYSLSERRHGVRVAAITFPFFIGIVVFTTRGDLMSSIAFSLAMAVCTLPLIIGSSRARLGSSGPQTYPRDPS